MEKFAALGVNPVSTTHSERAAALPTRKKLHTVWTQLTLPPDFWRSILLVRARPIELAIMIANDQSRNQFPQPTANCRQPIRQLFARCRRMAAA
jgi:hypothetical protein